MSSHASLRLLLIAMLAIPALPTKSQTFLSSWPVPDDVVFAVAHDPATNTVFIGGSFDNVGGQARAHVAAINTVSGTLTSWAPVIDGGVGALLVNGTTLYVAGDFGTVNGTTRNNIAAFDLTTGNLITTWNPNVSGTVEALALSGTTLYLGGDFALVQGVLHYNIAAVSTMGLGSPTAWDAGYIGDWVRSISVSGSNVYIGGWFTSVAGDLRSYVASLGTGSGAVLSWDPDAGDRVKSVLADGSTVYVAGSFYSIGGASRTGLAAIDASGNATVWNASLDGEALSVARGGNLVYVGGMFSNAGGQPRNGFAAIDMNTGLANAWDPAVASGPNDIFIYSIVVSGGKIFAGGDFATVGGASHPYFAAWSGAPSDVPEIEAAAQLPAGPNPCSAELSVNWSEPGARWIEITDVSGSCVRSIPFRTSIQTTDLAPGLYTVTVQDQSGIPMARTRIVKE